MEIPAPSPPPAPPWALEPGEVHVWQASLDVPASSDTLSDEERLREERLLTARLRRRFRRSRELLRATLAGYAGVNPAALEFSIGDQGKPALREPNERWRFNLSHSGPCWVLAVSAGLELGVDVERTTRGVDLDRVARRVFRAGELRTLASLPASARREAFFRCWASREAIVKAMGEGVFTTRERFEVRCDPGRPLAARHEDAGTPLPWELGVIPLPSGYLGVLATAALPARVRSWRLEEGP